MNNNTLNYSDVLDYLRKGIFEREILEQALNFDKEIQKELFKLACEKREIAFPNNEVEVRSVIEISNKCKQGCNYCSMGEKMSIQEFTINEKTLISLMDYLYNHGRRVILLQSGEDNSHEYINMLSRCIENIKNRSKDCIIILCLGNLSRQQYLQLRTAGADRYVIKFETSNPVIYRNAKPHDTLQNRLKCMNYILEAGFKLGSGNIVGLPGQSITDIVNDLLLMHQYNLSMNSSTVFIPAEGSVYKDEPLGDIRLTLNTMALMRIMNPNRLMPTTSSLDKAQKGGQLMGLMAGANTVTIHDGTPREVKDFFPIYSLKRVTPQSQHFEDIVAKANLTLSMEPLYGKYN